MVDRLRRISLSELTLYAGITAAVLLGGSARADVSSLIVLRPLGVIAFASALWGFRLKGLHPYRWQLGIALGALCLIMLQLVPLPPTIWSGLAGREIIADIDAAMAMPDQWRSSTMTPIATWNSLWWVLLPIAVLVSGTSVSTPARRGLLVLWLIGGLVSGLIGYLQVIAPGQMTSLYFYGVTNQPAGVGLFANRNHQAVLLACLFPMLAVFASGRGGLQARRIRLFVATATGVVLVPLILVTGSRAGLILGVVGLLAVPLLYQGQPYRHLGSPDSRRGVHFRRQVVLGAVAVAGLVLLALAMTRDGAVQRWFEADPIGSAGRLPVWNIILANASDYLPVGSGIGSFQQVFLLHEPDSLLSFTYRNQAHNDWLDLLMTGGLPALLLLAAALAFYGLAVRRMIGLRKHKHKHKRHRAAEPYFRLGLVIVGMLMVASLVDYPLRTPSLACLLATAALWLPLPRGDDIAFTDQHEQIS